VRLVSLESFLGHDVPSKNLVFGIGPAMPGIP
jgi:hypothetical protein